MARNFYVVTPCGGTLTEVHTTVGGAIAVAESQPSVSFVHYLVFNNGLTPTQVTVDYPSNYLPVVLDLGATGSRALARNSGLDEIAANGEPGIVCFMDAGDVLLDRGAIDEAFSRAERDPKAGLWAFSALIVGSDISSIRKPRHLRLRRINNPFLIGATFVTSDLAVLARFSEGSKEDWKYWLDLLKADPVVERLPEIAYEYRVVSTTNHIQRKARLFSDQYRFFSEYLGYGHGLRTAGSMLAHLAIAGTAWLRRSTRFRPTRRRSNS